MAAHCRLIAKRNGIILVETSEMIDSHYIIQLVAVLHSSCPPFIICILMIIPAIKRISPQLTRSGKCIRRTACHSNRQIVTVKLEELRIRPCIRTVKRNIDRNITNDLNPLIICIFFQFCPLLQEFKLQIFIKFNFEITIFPIIIKRKSPTETDIFSPFIPRSSVKAFLYCHKERIVIQPESIFLYKLLKFRHFINFATLIRLIKKFKSFFVNLPII